MNPSAYKATRYNTYRCLVLKNTEFIIDRSAESIEIGSLVKGHVYIFLAEVKQISRTFSTFIWSSAGILIQINRSAAYKFAHSTMDGTKMHSCEQSAMILSGRKNKQTSPGKSLNISHLPFELIRDYFSWRDPGNRAPFLVLLSPQNRDSSLPTSTTPRFPYSEFITHDAFFLSIAVQLENSTLESSHIVFLRYTSQKATTISAFPPTFQLLQ